MVMKRVLVIALFISAVVVAKGQQSIIDSILIKSVEEKVLSMQEAIGFDDDKAVRIKDVELSFLRGVNKAENCFLCNKKRKISNLNRDREKRLEEILDRTQYLKYQALDNDLINENNRIQLIDRPLH